MTGQLGVSYELMLVCAHTEGTPKDVYWKLTNLVTQETREGVHLDPAYPEPRQQAWPAGLNGTVDGTVSVCQIRKTAPGPGEIKLTNGQTLTTKELGLDSD